MAVKTRATLLAEAAANITDALTGQNSAADVRTRIEDLADSAIIQEAWENIASATTCEIGGTSSSFVNISGTTTIESFGTIGAGIYRRIKFGGALVLTHNATSLIIPGGANITTANGDRAEAVSEGSGNWRVLSYTKANGKPVIGPAIADITNAGAMGSSLLATADEAAFWTALSGAVATLTKGFRLGQASYELASGEITITHPGIVTIDTEAAASTGNLVTINGGTNGDIIILKTTSSSRDITVVDGSGNLRLNGNFIMGTINERLMLHCTGSLWAEVSRSLNS